MGGCRRSVSAVTRLPATLIAALVAGCAAPEAGVRPSAGRGAGGESLRITGRDFRVHGAPVVYVGAKAAKSVVVESDSLITALTPDADVAGVVDVTVQFADGEALDFPSAFAYGAPGVVLTAPSGD